MRALAIFVAVLAAAGAWTWTRSGATPPRSALPLLTVDTQQPRNLFAPGTVGLSIDANELGAGNLSARRSGLVGLMRLLGPSVLRIGGSSVDLSWWTSHGERPPAWAVTTITPADLTTLRGLLSATGWRVLLGVNLGQFDPTRAAEEAHEAQQILGERLVGIEIGNEPNEYSDQDTHPILRARNYDVNEYLREATAYRDAIAAATPGLAIFGPAASRTRWLTALGAYASLFTDLTQHYYPLVTCRDPLSASSSIVSEPTSAQLLSPATREEENETLSALSEAGATSGRPTLLGETGTGPCRGNSFSSPVFASALWSLDWALRAASSGAEGIYFHGHFALCGNYTQSPICAPSASATKVGAVTARPEYYGLLAASRLEGGRFIPTSLTASDPLPDLTSWATLAPNGTITIAVDNFAISGRARTVLLPMPGYSATVERLTARSSQARSGVTLGGARVTDGGQWQAHPETLAQSGGTFRLAVRAASATIVTLRRNTSS
jgi:hypothetical protein